MTSYYTIRWADGGRPTQFSATEMDAAARRFDFDPAEAACSPSALALDVLEPVLASIKAAGKLLKARYPALVFNAFGGENQAVISPLLPLPEGAAMRVVAMPMRSTAKAPISYTAAPLAARPGGAP